MKKIGTKMENFLLLFLTLFVAVTQTRVTINSCSTLVVARIDLYIPHTHREKNEEKSFFRYLNDTLNYYSMEKVKQSK